MSLPLLLLRPQPGNEDSAARAADMGLAVIQLPLFEIGPALHHGLPEDAFFDALLLTSANGARHGAELLERFPELPLYAVGDATADVARAQGRPDVIVGGGDAASTAAMIAQAGHESVLHLCGADVRPFDPQGLSIHRHVVYRAAERSEAAVRPALDAIGEAVVALHSPRAGRRLAELTDPGQRARFHLIAISAAAAAASGPGWAGVAISPSPDDTALLALAEALCRSRG